MCLLSSDSPSRLFNKSMGTIPLDIYLFLDRLIDVVDFAALRSVAIKLQELELGAKRLQWSKGQRDDGGEK